jgi:hypothetical protein
MKNHVNGIQGHVLFMRLVVLYIIFSIIPMILVAQASDTVRLNKPGDMFNLAAAMDILRNSPTLEAFERSLNTDTTHINQLDLNLDGKVDYIRVFDRPEGEIHTLILQACLGTDDAQDVAVFTVGKKNGHVMVEALGDEALYGPDYVIRPAMEGVVVGTPNPAYEGEGEGESYRYDETADAYASRPSYCPNPDNWIIVHVLFELAYVPWISPWYWGLYPPWWSPWSPWYWDTYYVHWYYYSSWPGWWYWHTAYPHSPHWYGPYRTIRRTSPGFGRSYTEGRFNALYQNPHPLPVPKLQPRFPSHSVELRRNPAVIRTTRTQPVAPSEVLPRTKKRDLKDERKTPTNSPVEPMKKDRWWKRTSGQEPEQTEPRVNPKTKSGREEHVVPKNNREQAVPVSEPPRKRK